jgi:hypothetical protein
MQLELDHDEAKLLAKLVHEELNYAGDSTDDERKMLSDLRRRLLSM